MGHEQGGFGLFALGRVRQAKLADLAVFVQEFGELQLGRVRRQAGEVNLHGFTFGKAADELAQVFFQAANHDVVEVAFEHLDAACESLRVEQFEQGAETVGMAIVGRGGEEKAVLEARGEVADGLGDAGINGVFRAAGRGGVVRLVEESEGSRGASCRASRGAARCRFRQSAGCER